MCVRVCLCQFVCVKSIKRALVSPNELHGKHECVFCLYEEHYWRPLAVEKVKTRSKCGLSPSTLISFSSLHCWTNQFWFCIFSCYTPWRRQWSKFLFLLCNCAVLSELYVILKEEQETAKVLLWETAFSLLPTKNWRSRCPSNEEGRTCWSSWRQEHSLGGTKLDFQMN